MRWIIRLLVNAIALWIAFRVVDGLHFEQGHTLAFLGLALVFGVVNALIRPIVKLFTFPLLILTLGIFTFVINALMLWLASWVGRGFGIPVTIDGFWPAFWGALVVTIVSWVLSMFIPDPDDRRD